MKPISIHTIVEVIGGTLLQGDDSLLVMSVTTNSKEACEGSLFVPIIGERVDAHNFIDSAMEQGAVCAFTSRDDIVCKEGKAYIKVEDTLNALQDLAAYYRSQFHFPIIGVTGSVGKTTTKEMISAVLEQKYHVVKTKGNMNSQIGLALMMFSFEEDTEMAVIEMGMSQFGEMERLVRIARPDVAVMTNVGVSHIGNLHSRENICKEKGNIVTTAKAIYICGNGDLIPLSKENIPYEKCQNSCETYFYGTKNECQYLAKNLYVKDQKTYFTFQGKEIVLSVLGEHNVNNALVAILLGERFGVDFELCCKALFEYMPMKMRGETRVVDGVTVIDDTYNASPDSITSGVDALFDYSEDGRKIAILADVLELGEHSEMLHRQVGEHVCKLEKDGKKLALLVTVGKEAAYIGSELKERGSAIPVQTFMENETAIAYIKNYVQSGDYVLVKGSRGMHMDQVVEALCEEA